AFLIVVFSQQAALAEFPVAAVANVQARDAAMAAVFANPPVVDLPEGQPIGEPAVVAFELKPGAVEVMFEQKIEDGGRRRRRGIAPTAAETAGGPQRAHLAR